MVLEKIRNFKTFKQLLDYEFDQSTYNDKFIDVFLKEDSTKVEVFNNIKHTTLEDLIQLRHLNVSTVITEEPKITHTSEEVKIFAVKLGSKYIRIGDILNLEDAPT
jgi:hypothetical protein